MHDTPEDSEIDRALADPAESGRSDIKTRNDMAVLEVMKRSAGIVVSTLAPRKRTAPNEMFIPERDPQSHPLVQIATDKHRSRSVRQQASRMIAIAPTKLPLLPARAILKKDHVPELKLVKANDQFQFCAEGDKGETAVVQVDATPKSEGIAEIPVHISKIASLEELESILEQAKRTEMAGARALRCIQEMELWRGTEFKSFEKYATTRWGYEQAQIYRLTAWAEKITIIEKANPPIGGLPMREVHSRAMNCLESDEDIAECWRLVEDRYASPTARDIKAVAEEILRRRQPPAPKVQQLDPSVICADAIEGLKTISDATIDLLLTSPPYAMQRAKDFPGVEEADFPEWMVNVLDAARPKLAPKASVLINIREHVKDGELSDYVLEMRLAIRAAGWKELEVLVWHKPDAPPLGRMGDRPRRVYDNVYWYSQTIEPFTDLYARGEPRTTQTKVVSDKPSGHFNGGEIEHFHGDRSRVTDVITATVGSIARGVNHSAMFPEGLAAQLIETYSPKGGMVCDCFCGSGTTLIAAKKAGRKYFGIDIKPEFVEIAKQRLADLTNVFPVVA